MQAEHQEHHKIEGASDRSFGLTVGGIFLAIEIFRLWPEFVLDVIGIVLLVISLPLILLGLVFPVLLAPLNSLWTKLGLVMFKIVNPIIMLAVFILTIIPVGLLLKLFGKDSLRLRMEPESKSYWIERDPAGPSPESMKNQF